MKDLILSALVGLSIDCSLLQDNISAEVWKNEVCRTFEGYEDVTLRPVRSVSKHAPEGQVVSPAVEVSKPVAGRVTVRRVIRSESGEQIIHTTFYSVKAFKDVWIARRNIDKETVIGRSDIGIEKRNVADFFGIKTLALAPPAGAYTERRFAKGQIIIDDYLRTKPLINKGKVVTALLSSGNLRISVRGVVMQNGFAENDSVKIRLIDTGVIKSGKVRDGETIILDI